MISADEISAAAGRLSRSMARLAESAAGALGAGLQQLERAVQAEKRRWVGVVVGAMAALFLLGFGILFGGIAIVLAFRDTSPAAAAAWVAAGLLALSLVAVLVAWRCARRPPGAAERIVRLLAMLLLRR